MFIYIYFNCTLFEGNEIITFHKKTTSSMPFYEKSFVIFQWVNPWIEIEYWPKIVNSVLLCIYMILHPPRSIWIVIKRRFILPSSKWDAFKSCVFVLFFCFFSVANNTIFHVLCIVIADYRLNKQFPQQLQTHRSLVQPDDWFDIFVWYIHSIR